MVFALESDKSNAKLAIHQGNLMKSIVLIASFIIMSLLSVLSPSFAMVIFLLMVFFIGLPHGALDLWILRKRFAISSFKTTILFITYLSLAIGIFFGLYWFSSFFFGFFLLYSAYHFGMDYYGSSFFQSKVCCYVLALLIGISIICLPALLYAQKMCVLFSYLIGSQTARLYAHFLHRAACYLLPAIGLVGLFTLKKECAKEVIIVLMASFLAPPLAFLTVYFVGIHSCKYFAVLYKKIGYSSYRAFIKDLCPMTLLTYALSITAYSLVPSGLDWQGAGFYLTIYVLAALTLPHLILVEMFKNRGF